MSAKGVEFLENWIAKNVTALHSSDDVLRAYNLAARCIVEAAAEGITLEEINTAMDDLETQIFDAMAHLAEPGTPSATQLEGPALRKQLMELIEKSTKFMPKGSQGAKRPNKAKGADIQAGRTAKGEAANKPNKAPSRAKGGKAGGSAKVKSKDSPRRKEITKLAAKARWEG